MALPFVYRPIDGFHAWRQSNTAAVSKNFYQESLNIFFPKIDIRGESVGIGGVAKMEFPLYQFIIALAYKIFGTIWDGFGILLSLLSSLAIIWITPKVFRIQRDSVIYFQIIMASCPLFFAWSTKFMPQTFGLALALFGYYYYKENKDSPKPKLIILSTIFFTIGVLVRPFYILWCFPILMDFCLKLRKRAFKKASLELMQGLFIITLFFGWYLLWGKYLTKNFNSNFMYPGSILKFENYSLSYSLEFLLAFSKIIFLNQMNFCFLAAFFVGILKLKNNPLSFELICILCLYSVTLPFIVGTTQIDYHPYYFLGVSPILAYVISQGIHKSLENKLLITSFFVFLIIGIGFNLTFTIPSKILMAGLFLPFIFYGVKFFFDYLYKRNKEVWGVIIIILALLMTPVISRIFLKPTPLRMALERIQPAVQKNVSPNDLIAITARDHAFPLYVLKLKGYPIAPPQMEDVNIFMDLKKQGVKWVIPYNENLNHFSLFKINDYIQNLK